MKMNWQQHIGKTLNITMFENYGVVYSKEKSEHPTFYEIVFKPGKLVEANDDGLILESKREETTFLIFVPFNSIKCIEIY
jgi:hypothetical protein